MEEERGNLLANQKTFRNGACAKSVKQKIHSSNELARYVHREYAIYIILEPHLFAFYKQKVAAVMSLVRHRLVTLKLRWLA